MQDLNAAIVTTAMAAVKDVDLKASVESLSLAECDVLMKYIYRGLSAPSPHTALFLRWHAAVTAHAGPGTIVRVITDKAREV